MQLRKMCNPVNVTFVEFNNNNEIQRKCVINFHLTEKISETPQRCYIRQ